MYKLDTKMTIENASLLAKQYYDSINPELGDKFIEAFNNQNITHISKEENNPRVSGNGHIFLTQYGDIRDLYTMVHEFSHYLDKSNKPNSTREVYTETLAQLNERGLDSFLRNLTEEQKELFQINPETLESDISKRNVSTFFNRYNNIISTSKIVGTPTNIEAKITDTSYMLAQLHSGSFEKLSNEDKRTTLNNIMQSIKKDNIEELEQYLPCNLSKKNIDRGAFIYDSLSSVQKHQELITKHKMIMQQDSTIEMKHN